MADAAIMTDGNRQGDINLAELAADAEYYRENKPLGILVIEVIDMEPKKRGRRRKVRPESEVG